MVYKFLIGEGFLERKEDLPMQKSKVYPFRRRGGYSPVYYEGTINHCPACGHAHWIVGRQSAECAICSTALPLESAYFVGSPRQKLSA